MSIEFPAEDVLVKCLARSWWPVALSNEIDRGPKETLLLDRPLVVYRGEGGSYYVSDAVCPHRGASLALGKVCGENIACPYHGWQFEGGTGRCARIPALGQEQHRIPKNSGLRSYRTRELWGIVWTCLEDEPPFNIPALDEISQPGWHRVSTMTPQDTNILFSCENFCDVAHFKFIHLNTFGYAEESVGKLEVQRSDYGASTTVHYDLGIVEGMADAYDASGSSVDFEYRFRAPGFIQAMVTSSTGARWFLTHFSSPATLEKTHAYRVVAVPPDHFSTAAELLAADSETYREDGLVTETIRPRRLGASLAKQQHTLADAFTLGVRNAFMLWIGDQAADITGVPATGGEVSTDAE